MKMKINLIDPGRPLLLMLAAAIALTATAQSTVPARTPRGPDVERVHALAAAAAADGRLASPLNVAVIMANFRPAAVQPGGGVLDATVMRSVFRQRQSANEAAAFRLELIVCTDGGGAAQNQAVEPAQANGDGDNGFCASEFAPVSMQVINLPRNVRVSTLLNSCLQAAKPGSLFIWASTDTPMAPHSIQELVRASIIFPEIDVFFVNPAYNDNDDDDVSSSNNYDVGSSPIHFYSYPTDSSPSSRPLLRTFRRRRKHNCLTAHDLVLGRASVMVGGMLAWRESTLRFDESLINSSHSEHANADMRTRLIESSASKIAVQVPLAEFKEATQGTPDPFATSFSPPLAASVAAELASRTLSRHDNVPPFPGSTFILCPDKFFPTLRLCVDRDACLADAYFQLGVAVAAAARSQHATDGNVKEMHTVLSNGWCDYFSMASAHAERAGMDFIEVRTWDMFVVFLHINVAVPIVQDIQDGTVYWGYIVVYRLTQIFSPNTFRYTTSCLHIFLQLSVFRQRSI